LGLSLRPGNRHHDAVGVTAESCVGWTIAGGSIGVAGFWLAGGGARDAEPHGSADFMANACPNVILGLAFPAVGAPILPRLPAVGSTRCTAFCRTGLPDHTRLGAAAATPKVVVNVKNCGAKVFLADFDDSNAPTWDNVATGQLNLRNAPLREIDFSTPKARGLAERKATAVLATGAQLMGHVRPGYSMLAATTLARMGERMPVAHTVHVPDASIHRVSAGGLLADPVHGPRTPIWRSTRTATRTR
jgi:malate synthase